MSNIDTQAYKDQLWSHLRALENYAASFYIDTKGVLTVGVGLNVVNQKGVETNRSVFEAASPSNSVADALMDRFVGLMKDYRGYTRFTNREDYNKSTFKAALDKVGIETSFEKIGERSSWAINVIGLKVFDENGLQVFDEEDNPLLYNTRNLFPINQARAATEAWILNTGLTQTFEEIRS